MSGRRTFRALLLVGVLLLGAAPAAHAQSAAAQRAADEVFQDYATDGRIDPCAHSAETLKLARDNITPDVEQYASEYPDAIDAAIAARGRGACSDGNGSDPGPSAAGGGSAAPPPDAPTPAPTASAAPQPGAPTETVVPDPPAPAGGEPGAAPTPAGADAGLDRAASARPDSGPPLPLVGLGAVLLVAAVMALLLIAARRLGIGDERLAPAGHALREARWRWQGAWDDFSDWFARGR